VTASEFAFLALGLVLGVAAGAALIEVARSRPPAPREIRVTVAPNSVRARATTLTDESDAHGAAGPARGGPGDRRWVDREDPPTETVLPARSPVPTILQPVGPGGGERDSVGVGVVREADPMMAALRMATTEYEVVPGRRAEDRGPAIETQRAAEIAPAGNVATMTMAPNWVIARMNGGGGNHPEDAAAVRSQPSGGQQPTAAGGGPGSSPGDAAASGGGTAPAPGGPATPGDPGEPDDGGPCADQRRLADERCAVATLARDGARRAAEALRTAQRDYDDHVGRAENMTASADPRAVRTAKETAQQAFRKARAAASTRDSIETAARDWLSEINRINMATRDATTQAEQHRAAAAALSPTLERLALEADAVRISAESAEEACVAAREAVAACEEAAANASAARLAGLPAVERPEEPGPAEREPDPRVAAGAAAQRTEVEDDEAMGSRAGEDAAIIRILRGDREILPRIVARLGGDDPEEQRRWRTLLTGLIEALVARSIEASSFDFPAGHSFWGLFTPTQCRDIAAALASLGYRHDGFGDWADDRIPSQRDLSMAVGYAGFDPMRFRHWPAEDELHELLRDVTVAADEYVREAAGALTLGELVSLLGRRADGLTDLWNEWGAVRPLLLAAG
jgi:hypothetical protein